MLKMNIISWLRCASVNLYLLELNNSVLNFFERKKERGCSSLSPRCFLNPLCEIEQDTGAFTACPTLELLSPLICL